MAEDVDDSQLFILRTGVILRFCSPTPTLPRWEREFMKSADYARSQYKPHRRHYYQLLANEKGIAHWKVSVGHGVFQLAVRIVY